MISWPILRTGACQHEVVLRELRDAPFAAFVNSAVISRAWWCFRITCRKGSSFSASSSIRNPASSASRSISSAYGDLRMNHILSGRSPSSAAELITAGTFSDVLLQLYWYKGKIAKHVFTCTCCHKQVTRGQGVYHALNG